MPVYTEGVYGGRMLVRITAAALLAASYATAAHAADDGASTPDRAVEQRESDTQAQNASVEAGGAIELPETPTESAEADSPPSTPPARPVPVPQVAVRAVWDRLASCESSGNWHINTGNGYYGGVQQDMTFWRRYGGTAYAARPDLASREQQVLVAERGLAVQGWAAWPRCSRMLGLR